MGDMADMVNDDMPERLFFEPNNAKKPKRLYTCNKADPDHCPPCRHCVPHERFTEDNEEYCTEMDRCGLTGDGVRCVEVREGDKP